VVGFILVVLVFTLMKPVEIYVKKICQHISLFCQCQSQFLFWKYQEG